MAINARLSAIVVRYIRRDEFFLPYLYFVLEHSPNINGIVYCNFIPFFVLNHCIKFPTSINKFPNQFISVNLNKCQTI